MDKNEVMTCRKVKAVIRYHTPNKNKEPESYYHHLLFLYFPWRDESSLLGAEQTYASKFSEPNVQNIVEQNRSIFEPDGNAITEALESLRNSQGQDFYSLDPLNDQENADISSNVQDDLYPRESFNEQLPSELSNFRISQQATSPLIRTHSQSSELSDDCLHETIRSLNQMQRYTYNHVLSWCRNTVKNMNCNYPEKVDPVYLFISGGAGAGAGAGKSHLIRAVYQSAVKTFRCVNNNPELPTVLLMAPTGVAAVNIGGTTINTALAIPKDIGDNITAMSDQKKTQMRLMLKELKLLILDEVSMVSNTMILHIHQRLKEIFGTPNSMLFACLSVIVVGDLYQLPPIRRKPIFEDFKNVTFNLSHPWLVH